MSILLEVSNDEANILEHYFPGGLYAASILPGLFGTKAEKITGYKILRLSLPGSFSTLGKVKQLTPLILCTYVFNS